MFISLVYISFVWNNCLPYTVFDLIPGSVEESNNWDIEASVLQLKFISLWWRRCNLQQLSFPNLGVLSVVGTWIVSVYYLSQEVKLHTRQGMESCSILLAKPGPKQFVVTCSRARVPLICLSVKSCVINFLLVLYQQVITSTAS